MMFSGAELGPVPESTSVWTWLFDRKKDKIQGGIRQSRHGFRDGTSDQRISFSDLEGLATSCAAALRTQHNLQPHQTVAIVAQNSVAYTVAVFAAARIGAVAAVLPSMALSQDIAYYLESSSAKIVFYDHSTAEELSRAWNGREPPPYTAISLDETKNGENESHICIWELARGGQSLRDKSPDTPAWAIPSGQSNKKICAFMAFSSGTTGRPKAV